MPENKHLKFLLTVAYLALGGAALWLALHFLLPWTLPFLLALLLAALLERPVTFFMDRLRLPRWAAAALCTVLLLLAVGAVLFLCVWRLWYEGSLLLGRLPSLLSALPSLGAPLERWAYRFIIAAPPQMQEPLREALETLAAQSAALPDWLYRTLSTWTVSALAALPDWGLFLFTTGLATYFTSAGRPALLAFLRRQAPPSWAARAPDRVPPLPGNRRRLAESPGHADAHHLRRTDPGFFVSRRGSLHPAGGPHRAGGCPACIRHRHRADPLGPAGTTFRPFFHGAWALRPLPDRVPGAQPAGAQAGGKPRRPSPLAALLCMYVGFRAFGVVGMVLSPLAAILIKEAHDCGIVRLWRD